MLMIQSFKIENFKSYKKDAEGIGFGDYSIIKDLEEQSNLFQGWSLRFGLWMKTFKDMCLN